MSVSILYYKVSPEKINSAQLCELISRWIDELPVQKQQQIRKLRQQKDQVLSLAGLQLLKIGIADLCNDSFSLSQLHFPDRGKPFFGGQLEGKMDFNISHSGDIAVCVISDRMKVGIDIELLRHVKPATMNKYLSNNSTNTENTEATRQQFFDLWTKNEAIIKASGHGSIYTMNEIILEPHSGFYQNQRWQTYPVHINPDVFHSDNMHSNISRKEYTCHIACSEKITASELEQIKPRQIHNL